MFEFLKNELNSYKKLYDTNIQGIVEDLNISNKLLDDISSLTYKHKTEMDYLEHILNHIKIIKE